MRRFLLSGSFVSAIFAGVTLLLKTVSRPLSWRTLLLWASWAISLVLAIAAINERQRVLDQS
jgi:hypothetical protein